MDTEAIFHRLGVTPQQLAEFCQQANVTKLEVFGSLRRDDFRADSDIDFLVTFAANCPIDLLGFVRLERELEMLLGRSVDLISKQAVMSDRNWLRRREILETSQVIYESRPAVSA